MLLLQWFSLHLEILIIWLSKWLLIFRLAQWGTPLLITQLLTILVLIEMVFVIILEMFHVKISWSLVFVFLVLFSEFFGLVQVGTDAHIPQWKYRVTSMKADALTHKSQCFGPRRTEDPIKSTFCMSVSPSVCSAFFSGMAHQVLLIFDPVVGN